MDTLFDYDDSGRMVSKNMQSTRDVRAQLGAKKTMATIGEPYQFQQLRPNTLSYVRSKLTGSQEWPHMLFGRTARAALPLDEGSVFSWLPLPARPEWLRYESDAGLETLPFENAYKCFVRAFLAQSSSLVVMEADTIPADRLDQTAPLLERDLSYRYNADETFVYLTHNATNGMIDSAIDICHALNHHAFFMNAYPKAYTWKSGSEISTEEIHDVISHCDSLVISAYDYMGFILWTRDPEGCIRLNTPASSSE